MEISLKAPMNNWVHCNKCFARFHESPLFFLVCKHIACDNCVTPLQGPSAHSALNFVCPLCALTVQGTEIGNDMPNRLKQWFRSGSDIPLSTRMLKFQRFHQQHLKKRFESQTVLSETTENAVPCPKIEPENHFWIHCNKCFYLYLEKWKKLLVLSCCHIACEGCAAPLVIANTLTCPICKELVVATVIANDLPGHLKMFFHPTPELEESFYLQVYHFQAKHRNHLSQHFEQLRCLHYNIEKERQTIKEKYGELMQLRHYHNRLVDRAARLRAMRKKHPKSEESQFKASTYQFMSSFKPLANSSMIYERTAKPTLRSVACLTEEL